MSDPFSDPHSRPNMPVPKSTQDSARDAAAYDYSRSKLARSQTSNPPPTKPPVVGRRSHSQDVVPGAVEKTKPSGKSRKKGSQHADVIDRLDFTGVGPMFHHDGPFDACAPSRNRHRSKAPMMAWTPRPEDAPAQYNDNPYPSPNAYKAFSNESTYDPPKKKVDAIAEAWGIHEPEPFEEFFAGGGTRGDTPASSIYNGKDTHTPSRSKRGKEPRADDANPSSSRARATRRSALPPPQPIFIADTNDVPEMQPSGSPTTGFPKRSKSLMHRIRKMRDAPNVPVAADYEEPPASPPPSGEYSPAGAGGSRPSHRNQNSFLGGMFNGNSSKPDASPESFVFIDAHTNKDLPATPHIPRTAAENGTPSLGYFEGSPTSPQVTSPGGGLGRKTSLMKKVGRVVRGTR